MQSEPLVLDLEFVRKSSSDDPYKFQFTPQEYILRRGQGAYDEAHFPWTAELLQTLAEVRRPGRSPDQVQRLGDTLRRFLSTTGWGTVEALILSAVDIQRPVVLTVRSAAAELYALPWELMTLQQGGQHLGELPSVLVRYAWPDTSAAPEEPRREPGGRILLAWSAAGGAVPAAEHQHALERACAEAALPFERENDILPHVTCERLVRALEQAKRTEAPIAVLHLLCHGAAIGGSFGLAFDDDTTPGATAVVDAARLRMLLAPYAGMVRLVVISACDGANSGALGNHLGSIAQELHRARIAQVVASRYPLSVEGSIRLTETFYDQLLNGPSDVAQAFRAARQRLAQDPTGLDWAAVQLYSAADPQQDRPVVFSPYPGLRPLGASHRRFFCGREQESDSIAGRLLALGQSGAPRLLTIMGPSGSGKSSLLCAGAIPEILARIVTGGGVTALSPGPRPVQALERACAGFTTSQKQLLIVDAFEELFTQGAAEDERQNFCRLLWRLATSDSSNVSVLIGLRSDFVARAAELLLDAQGRKLGAVLSSSEHGIWLTSPRDSQLRDAIMTPAARVGLRLEAGLLERIVEDLDGQPGALPLLQMTMQRLWLHRDGNRLTQQAFDGLAGVVGVLNAHADQVIAAMDPEEMNVAQQLLLRLGSGWTTSDLPSRRRVTIAALRPASDVQRPIFARVLERLIHQRLVVASSSADEQGPRGEAVEVAHDALLRGWPWLLSRAEKARPMLAVREDLDRWLMEWRSHRTLLTGSRLGYALQMAEGFPDAVDDEVRELLALSERTRAAEEELKLRGLDTLRLLAAKSVFSEDHTRIAAALVETRSDEVTTIPGWLEEAVDILHHQVLCTAEIEHGWALWDARWSPEGQAVVLAGLDGTAQIWDAGADRLQRVGGQHDSPIYRAIYSPDGERLLTLCGDGTAKVWSVVTGDLLADLLGHRDAIEAGCWSRDGSHVVTASDDQTARIFDSRTGKQLAVLKGPRSAVMGVAFAPDGRCLYTAYDDGTVSVFVKDDRGEWSGRVLIESGSTLTALAISADGTQLATGSTAAAVCVYDLSKPGEPIVLWGHEGAISMVGFSPDGDHLVSCSLDRTAWLWSLRSERPPCVLMGHRMAVQSASFSRDGTQIVTACSDGRARIWDATRAGLDDPRRITHRVRLPGGLVHRTARLVLKSADITCADRTYRATVTGATTVQITPPADHGPPFSVDTGPDAVSDLGFTPDGDRLVVVAMHRILVCDLKERSLRWFVGHTYAITCFAISANSAWLITGAEDWTARVWPLAGSGESRVLSGHEATPVLVLFDQESRRAMTVEQDGATRIWPQSGPPIVLLPRRRSDHAVAISPDWKQFVTQAAGDEAAPQYLWDLELEPRVVQSRLRAANRLKLSDEEYQMVYLSPPRPAVPR